MEDLQEILVRAGLPVRTQGRNVGAASFNLCCPFCQEERFHLGIHQEHWYFHCWVCNASGGWHKLRDKLIADGVALPKQLPKRQDQHHYVDDKVVKKLTKSRKPAYSFRSLAMDKDAELIDWLLDKPTDLTDELRPRWIHKDYLASIKIGLGTRKNWLCFPEGNSLVWRITPFAKLRDDAKWLTDGTNCVWGLAMAIIKATDTLWLTEGIFDAMRLPPGQSVAVLGDKITSKQLVKILDELPSVSKMIIAFDPDVRHANLSKLYLDLQALGIQVDRFDASQQIIASPVKMDLDNLCIIRNRKFWLDDEKASRLI